MLKKYLLLISLIVIVSCSKKHLPQTTNTESNATNNKTVVAKKRAIPKGPWPKTLSVDDRIASKTIDGRLYFDFDGKRYWKNYKDGKYYLFNKSIYNDPAFKLN